MTNDQPIRFRTFADEDDAAWAGRDGRHAEHPAGTSAAEPEPLHLGAARAPAETRRTGSGPLIAWGTGLALVAGVVIAVTLLPKPGSMGGDGRMSNAALQVHRDVSPHPGKLASSALLPCYVNGASAGSLTLADCGARNGVASGRLDVGLTSPPSDGAVPSPDPSYAPIETSARPAVARPRPGPNAGVLAPAPSPPAYAALDVPRQPPYPSRSSAYDENANRSADTEIDPEDSVRAAQTFYEGLADADGARAASVVVPEKRRQGPLSEGAITRYYSGLRAPLRITRLYPIDGHTVVARYAFVDRDGEVCQGTARVTTTQRDGEVYVQGIKALNGC